MNVTESRRLILRTWAPDDLDAGLRLWGDAEVMRLVGEPLTRDQVAAAIRAGMAHQENHGCQHWAVVDRETGDVIGCCGFNTMPGWPEFDDALELAVHFARHAWGRGYATEALRASVGYAFGNLSPARLLAWTDAQNLAMLRVLERTGFECLGDRPCWDDDASLPCFVRRAPIR
ncbi:MAG: GNAT family N-acetyltransferase [Planctomycetota bacterium]